MEEREKEHESETNRQTDKQRGGLEESRPNGPDRTWPQRTRRKEITHTALSPLSVRSKIAIQPHSLQNLPGGFLTEFSTSRLSRSIYLDQGGKLGKDFLSPILTVTDTWFLTRQVSWRGFYLNIKAIKSVTFHFPGKKMFGYVKL